MWMQSFHCQIDTLYFQVHTSDSIVRISLVIDRTIDLQEEKGNYRSTLKMQVICTSEFRCKLKYLLLRAINPHVRSFFGMISNLIKTRWPLLWIFILSERDRHTHTQRAEIKLNA